MKPLFTIHAAEYLVADYIERNYHKAGNRLRVWVPSKDDGIDLLVTNENCQKTVSLQVKYSKDFEHDRKYDAHGWWNLDSEKLKTSKADFWVFVLPKTRGSNMYKDCYFVGLSPKELARRLRKTGKKGKTLYMYLFVQEENSSTNGSVVIETRGLSKEECDALLENPKGDRDFTQFLNNWNVILGKVLQ